MLRWHRRLKATKQPNEVEDFLYAFFVTCAHVRDWLLATKAVPQRALEAFCSSEEFRLCQDFRNAIKHFPLSDPRQRREFSLAREYLGVGRVTAVATRRWSCCPAGSNTMPSISRTAASTSGSVSFALMATTCEQI
jgi:hypothetical protein